MKIIILKVLNTSKCIVTRGGIHFYPGIPKEIKVKENSSFHIQLKACEVLKLKNITHKEAIDSVGHGKPKILAHINDNVVTKVTDDSKAEIVEPVVKEEPIIEPVKEEIIEEKKEIKPVEDKKENLEAGIASCPYCEFSGTSVGLGHHVRQKHSNKYEEFLNSRKG